MSYPIQSIDLQGVKSFTSPQHMRLRPLTLVFGANGVGKSTLLRLPLLLLASVRPGVQGLDLSAGGVEHGARVADLFPAIGAISTMRFALHLHPAAGKELRLGADLQRWTDGTLERLRISKTLCGARVEDIPFEMSSTTSRRFFGWAPADWDAQVLDVLRQSAESILHLGPFRARPGTVFPMPISPSASLGHLGEGAPGLLAADQLWGSGALVAGVNDWYRKTFGISVRVDSQGQRAFLLMADLPEGGSVPFAALGSGMTQGLPAVVALCLGAREEGRLICLEEPELHLHPAAHAPLGQLLVDVARLGQSTVLVETHSENLLLRVRRAVVQGELPREHLALYWVERRGSESTLRELSIDEDGFVPD
jgi:energy-coupling factor transporter ATP-binding protein EcfA2